MRTTYRVIVSVLLLAAGAAARLHAQPQQVRFEHLTVADGLSSNHVTCLLQDRRGFMWIGTVNGLNRYDGYRTTIYKHDPSDPGSLADNWVMGLYEDDGGALWVGTFGGGLNRFDPQTETFTHYRHDPDDSASLSGDFVGPLHGAGDGAIWVGTEGGGLDRFDPDTETFTHYRHDPDDPASLGDPADAVRTLYEDGAGVLWVGTWGGGLNRFDPETGAFTRFLLDEDGPANTVLGIAEDGQGRLWVATEHYGLNRFDRRAERFVRVGDDAAGRQGPGSEQVGTVFADHRGVLWVGTWGAGLSRLDPDDGAFTRFTPDPTDLQALSDDNVTTLYEDRAGVLWVGTRAGVDRFDLETSHFSYYRHAPLDPNSLAGPDVRAVLEDRDGVVWIGTRGAGLDRFDPATGRYTHYRHDSDDARSLSHDHVQALYEDGDGVLWVGTWGGGLDRFDRATGTFTRFVHDPDRPGRLHSNTVLSIHEGRDGLLWIGTWDGLSRFDRRTGTFRRIPHRPADLGTLGHVEVWAVLEDRQGTLWVGTRDGGLKRFDHGAERYTSFLPDPGDTTSLGHASVWALHEDRRGDLWVATGGGGLNRFDRRTGTFTRFTHRNSGLPDNVVCSIVEDERGRLWISTTRGLSRFDPDAGTFHNFSIAESVRAAEFNPAAYARGHSGTLYFGYGAGLVSFRPEAVRDNPHAPAVALLDVTVFDESGGASRGSSLAGRGTPLRDLTLAYDQNDLSFDYVGLHFSDPSRNRYAYMLAPYDVAWRDAGTQRQATYTNLDPGAYVFRVRAANGDGVWNEAVAALAFVIRPPWWQTWWFRLFAALAVAGLAFGAYHGRVRQIKLRNQALAAEVDARTAELEQALQHLVETQDQLVHAQKMASLGQLTAGIAHEIKNPLNFVNNFAALSGELVDDLGARLAAVRARPADDVLEDVEHVLEDLRFATERVATHGQRVDAIVRSMMLHARGAAGQRQPTDLNVLLDEHADLAYHGMRARIAGFSVHLERAYDETIGPVDVVPGEIGRVLINLFNNAFDAVHERSLQEAAHNGGAYVPTVRVATAQAGTCVEIRVRDNGTGIPADRVEDVFVPFFTTKPAGEGAGLGLSLSYDIVVYGHGGSLRVETEEGAYTEFILALPEHAPAPSRSAG